MRITYNEEKGQEQFNRTCPYCKKNVILYRSGNNAVFFDGKVYHTDCYLKSKSVERKCKNCKKVMHFNSNEDVLNQKVYYYMGSFYCKNCFEDLCHDGIQRKSKKWISAFDNKDLYLVDAQNKLLDLLKAKSPSHQKMLTGKFDLDDYVAKIFAEHDVNEFLKENYNIPTSSGFYHRYLQPLYQGTSTKYPDIKIPAIHLLEMWKTKLPSFQKQYQKRIQQGKSFSNVQLAAYDLAILISKYDSFLTWKNKQKVLESEKQNESIDVKSTINYRLLKPKQNIEKDSTDINNILHDIFE